MLLSQTQWPSHLSMPARDVHSPTSPLPMASNLVMKRHKTLPHPRAETPADTASRIGNLPPTPPGHSRQSSSDVSMLVVPAPDTPSTPPHEKSPPTPDVTPPKISKRPALRNTTTSERYPSSRAESFKTAREQPLSSDDDDEHVTQRRPPVPRRAGLGLTLKDEFIAFDGNWAATPTDEVEKVWDDNLGRHVMVKKRPDLRLKTAGKEVLDETPLLSSNATKFVRSMPFDQSPRSSDATKGLRRSPPDESPPSTPDVRRFSNLSFRSHPSTIVEAIVMDTTPQRQKTLRHVKKRSGLRSFSDGYTMAEERRRTPEKPRVASMSMDNRNVERQPRVLAPVEERKLDKPPKRLSIPIEERKMEQPTQQAWSKADENQQSTQSFSTSSSAKSRRKVWESGAIPVVVVPDRGSSSKRHKSPSLRSMSTHKRSVSAGSARTFGEKESVGRPAHRRTVSESVTSGNSSVRTMDYPPMVPIRGSSLSAPTSRNTSRASSLTSDSLKAHNLQQALAEKALEPANHETQINLSTKDQPSARVTPFSVFSFETGTIPEIGEATAVTLVPHMEKPQLIEQPPKKSISDDQSRGAETLHSRDASTEVYSHEGYVPSGPISDLAWEYISGEHDHDADSYQNQPEHDTIRNELKLETTSTPPETSVADVESPLRNPRQAPQPPAIKFIPATPAGLEADETKQLGHPSAADDAMPKRSESLIRRALRGRRNSESIIPRSFSLRRKSVADESSQTSRATANPDLLYPTVVDQPADESKLHPFWRPAHFWDDLEEGEPFDDESLDTETPWPQVDNRPSVKRNLSSTLKRTFAILPIKDDYCYGADDYLHSPDQRAVRRSPSGNMRVVKHRRSAGSLRRAGAEASRRPYTITTGPSGGKLHTIPGLGVMVEYVGISGLKRRFSDRKREKRSEKLRQTISAPRDPKIGTDDVLRNYQRDEAVQTDVPSYYGRDDVLI